MAKAFKAETAMKAIEKKEEKPKVENKTSIERHRLYRNFYNLETGDPVAFDTLSKRIKKRFSDIDKSSALAMMELWFLHAQWSSFYSRSDSFSKYIRDELQISKTHAYAILNSVEMLNQYYIHKGNSDSEIDNFINQICSSIEDVGIKKLSILSKWDSNDEKFTYLDRLLIEGEQITAENLIQTPEKKEKPKLQKTSVKLDSNDLKVGNILILTFNYENKSVRKAVIKAVEKWYLKDQELKKVNM